MNLLTWKGGWIFVFIFLIICEFKTTIADIGRTSNIVLSENGYSNILIAFHDSIPNSQNYVTKTQEAFTSASKRLYEATRHRAYFKQINILVPDSWSDQPHYHHSNEHDFNDADIIISNQVTNKRSAYGTRAFAGCGHQGIHMLLSGSHIVNPTQAPMYNALDKYLVQQWAKFRWGVFEESPAPGEYPFFFSLALGRPNPVQCISALRGRIIRSFPNGTRTLCYLTGIDSLTGLLPEGCQYYPYPRGNGVNDLASLMNLHFISEVTQFCDDGQSRTTRHDPEPPNRQNRLCNHRSTWDVIQNTTDFSGGANPPRDAIDPTPTFTFIKRARRKRSVVYIDGGPQLSMMHKSSLIKSTLHFIQTSIEDQHDIIIMSASGRHISVSLEDNIHHKISSMVDDDTILQYDIILRKLLRILRSKDKTNLEVVILTNTYSNSLRYVMKKLQNLGIKIHLIYHNINSSNIVNGQEKGVYLDSDGPRTTMTYDIIHRILDKSANSKPLVPVFSIAEFIPSGITSKLFHLDDNVKTKDGVDITLDFSDSLPSNVTLTGPFGIRFMRNSFSVFSSLNILKFRLPETSVVSGSWSLMFYSETEQNMRLVVTLRTESQDYIILRGTMKFVNKSDETPVVGLFAEVMEGHQPLVGAVIKATLFRPGTSTPYVIQLIDNGLGADIEGKDGIYSQYFTQFTGPGLYSMRVDMFSALSTKKLQLMNISRTSHGGHLVIPDTYKNSLWIYHGAQPDIDIYPPSKVTDLKLSTTENNACHINITWSLPGDDMDLGQAHRYELRYHESGQTLLKSPEKGTIVPDSALQSSSQSKLGDFGHQMSVAMNVCKLQLQDKRGLALLVQSFDRKGNPSAFSNLATVELKKLNFHN